MKKLILLVCLFAFALGGKAQVSVWYGVNLSKVGGDGSGDSELKFVNAGVAYTLPISGQFDWAPGLSYVTKGQKDFDPSLIQLNSDFLFNVYKTDDYKVSILAGPYAGYVINDDDAELKSLDFGVNFGAQGTYKKVSLKVGYELGLANIVDVKDYSAKLNGLYFRVGYNF